MERVLFEAVQQKLTDQWSHRNPQKNKADHLLAGLLFDDTGNPMVATHATKNGVRYRYYIARPHLYGQSKTATLGAVSRVPAAAIEAVITQAVTDHKKNTLNVGHYVERKRSDPASSESVFDARSHIERVDIRSNELLVRLRSQKLPNASADDADPQDDRDGISGATDPHMLRIPWKKPPGKSFRQILLPSSAKRQDVRPIRAERRVSLIAAIARGRRWLKELVSGTVTSTEDIAAREKCSVRQVNLTISLAFLAPRLVKAAVEGRLPRGIGVERLRDPPAEWQQQFDALGFSFG